MRRARGEEAVEPEEAELASAIAQAEETARAENAAYKELREIARAENAAYMARLPPSDDSRWPAVSDSGDDRCRCNHRRWINRDSYVLGHARNWRVPL